MNKLLATTILAGACLTPLAASAHTNLSIGLGLGGPVYAPEPVYYDPPPVYVAPAPVYVEPPVVYGPTVVYDNYYRGGYYRPYYHGGYYRDGYGRPYR